MDTPVTSAEAQQPPLTIDQVRLWSILAQVAFLVNYIIPFGGVIATAMIMVILGDRNPVIRENARVALNRDLTAIVAAIILVAVVIAGVFSTVFLTESHEVHAFMPMAVGGTFALLGIGYMIYTLVAVVLNSFAISRDELASYSLSFDIIRKK